MGQAPTNEGTVVAICGFSISKSARTASIPRYLLGKNLHRILDMVLLPLRVCKAPSPNADA